MAQGFALTGKLSTGHMHLNIQHIVRNQHTKWTNFAAFAAACRAACCACSKSTSAIAADDDTSDISRLNCAFVGDISATKHIYLGLLTDNGKLHSESEEFEEICESSALHSLNLAVQTTSRNCVFCSILVT
ncbi:MAG: hypothetical protein GC179_22235 [Anaerolineaceae bacterium]|nr:hypothetical protein [Anaerolineaceae bacterium]